MIRLLNNNDYDDYELFLKPFAATSMFLRSNALRAGLEYNGQDFQGEYLGSFDESDRLNGVLAHYWNHNLMMHVENDRILMDLLGSFQRACSKRPVKGILGPDRYVERAINTILPETAEFAINRSEGLYSLDLGRLKMPHLSSDPQISMQEASDIDRSLLKNWLRDFEIEALGAEDNQHLEQTVHNRVQRTVNSGDSWVLVHDGLPVGLSGISARLPDIVQIGPVWTPPEFRGRGYARTLVSLILAKAKQEDVKQSVLFTDNPAAARAYNSIGYEKTGTYRLALLKSPVLPDMN